MQIRNLLKDSSEKEMFTYTDLVQKHGWTKSLIDKYLPEPIIKSFTYNRGELGFYHIKLYPKDIVYNVESRPEVRKKLKESYVRENLKYLSNLSSENSSESYKKDTAAIDEVIDGIKVIYVKPDILDQLAYNYMKDWMYEHPICTKSVDIHDKDVLNRAAVLYICENLTNCEQDINILNKCHCKQGDFIRYWNSVYSRISEVYPKYRKECQGQITNGKLNFHKSEVVSYG